ncbi:hypothetical protein FXN80_10930 [Dickeya fangzhongdai]|uniref:hypothetical protein n=1 Tax=Dickeya fangzhongdai TaxID=1778540 RepID=UPI00136D8AB5|nr:hypothetical protein [Dickeya fangzhongdai]UMB78875.1 hypothetical protein FXN80_10930 [Dickeya fangzhongdai]
MPPDLTASYTKDLSIELNGQKELIETFHFFTREGGFFRADEYLVIGGDYQYYLDVYSIGCTTPDFYLEHGEEMLEMGANQQDIVNTLLSLDMEDEAETRRVGRVAYRDFNFNDIGGAVVTAKQIKSAVIDHDFRGAGLASYIYKMLTEKHEHLVCDSIQSISGGSLWASSILSIADVRIYDTNKKKFVDVLGKMGLGVNGLIPWSSQHLTVQQIVEWGRNSSHEPRSHIVNIISRDGLY